METPPLLCLRRGISLENDIPSTDGVFDVKFLVQDDDIGVPFGRDFSFIEPHQRGRLRTDAAGSGNIFPKKSYGVPEVVDGRQGVPASAMFRSSMRTPLLHPSIRTFPQLPGSRYSPVGSPAP